MKTLYKTLYVWQGKNAQGLIITGEISAQSSNLAIANLQKKGLKFITIHKKRRQWFQKKISAFEIILFFRQLATLFLAGINLSQAIQILEQQAEQSNFVKILSYIRDDILAGNNLGHSIQKFPKLFDNMTCHLVLAGEKSGTLDTMLQRVATHKERIFTLKNKMKQVLFYPITILIVAITITIIMLIFVVPRFNDLFQNMHTTLPAFTLFVVNLAAFLKNESFILFILLILISGLLYFSRNHFTIKSKLDFYLLKIPVAGISLQKFILAHLARSLATLYTAGVPIAEGLKILTDSTGNIQYKHAIHHLYLGISAGKQLHLVMQDYKLFPTMMVQMIRVGEESGTLEIMLSKIADFYESDLDHLITQLGRLLEPLIMVILGVVIGGLVIAMYLPIFRLGAVF